jgi:hypothetical protein
MANGMVTYRDNTSDCKSEVSTLDQSLHCCVAFDWKSPKIALTWLMCLVKSLSSTLHTMIGGYRCSAQILIVSKTWPMGWSRIETTHQIANVTSVDTSDLQSDVLSLYVTIPLAMFSTQLIFELSFVFFFFLSNPPSSSRFISRSASP